MPARNAQRIGRGLARLIYETMHRSSFFVEVMCTAGKGIPNCSAQGVHQSLRSDRARGARVAGGQQTQWSSQTVPQRSSANLDSNRSRHESQRTGLTGSGAILLRRSVGCNGPWTPDAPVCSSVTHALLAADAVTSSHAQDAGGTADGGLADPISATPCWWPRPLRPGDQLDFRVAGYSCSARD